MYLKIVTTWCGIGKSLLLIMNFKVGFGSSNPLFNWIRLNKKGGYRNVVESVREGSIFEVEIKSSTYCVSIPPYCSLLLYDVSFSIGPLGNGRRFWHLPRDGMMIIKQAKKYGEK